MKKTSILSVIVCALLSVVMLASCNTGNLNPSDTDGNSTLQARQLAWYQLYADSSRQNNEEPMSYKEWLETLQGKDGKTPHIGENGNWWIGTTDTGVQAQGEKGDAGADGLTPYIGNNGNWWIGTTDTGVQAQGEINATGIQGPKGEKGEKGEKGPQGPKGEKGDTGTDGKSAYEIYKKVYGYTGTETEWLTDLANGTLSTVKPHTVIFDSNGGSTIANQTVRHGEKATCPTTPAREGYMFEGWYLEDEKWSFGGHIVTENITLTAKWSPLALYYTLNSDGTFCVSGYDDIGYAINELVIPETHFQIPVTSIGEEAFTGCTWLTSITISDSITNIGKYAFKGCTSLSEVTIGNGATSIGDYAFSACTSLTDVAIGNGATSIGDYAFAECTCLTSVTIGNSVTSIGNYAFYGCTCLTSVTIGNNVTSIGEAAFYGCTGLTKITIPDSVSRIEKRAFYGCTGLTSIVIPDSVSSIDDYAFYKCTGLKNVTITNSVTSIGDYSFQGCTGLTKIIIPNSVTSIGYRSFYDCTGLTIYCEAAAKPSGWDSSWNPSNRTVIWGYQQ